MKPLIAFHALLEGIDVTIQGYNYILSDGKILYKSVDKTFEEGGYEELNLSVSDFIKITDTLSDDEILFLEAQLVLIDERDEEISGEDWKDFA